ncbi:rab-GTPase-TBC domain-domain-containing protein [Catenaria anguillulae PL171]|uniref:Rab-GTPase-TBC domain-domain-containing protein n=1 Tax=Catenaria anguillulae PL171 TaxID=765915 RepID=A0A1Y2HCJ7_9FUNG|nr:rab-GTPase-TBC domain-domain-containing protein [Catenaria anguillulae PL171]
MPPASDLSQQSGGPVVNDSSPPAARSFWRRQVSRLPGSIRPVGGSASADGQPKVFGAQHTFASPASIAAKLLSSSPSDNQSSSHSSNHHSSGTDGSPRSSRKQLKTRDQLVDQTSDAWGELETPGPLPSSTAIASIGKSSSTASSSSVILQPPPAGRRSSTDASSSSTSPSTANSSVSTLPSVTNANNRSSRASSVSASAAGGVTAAIDPADRAAEDEVRRINAKLQRHTKFHTLLSAPTLDLPALRKLAWSGIPDDLRPDCWKLLMGYLPCSTERRATVLARKRADYEDTVLQSLGTQRNEPTDKPLMHQIHIDVLRTRPSDLYTHERVQAALERILYCWAMRHPASGYVQGINDLLTPFFSVYLQPELDAVDGDVAKVKEEVLTGVEADAFWCLTKLIDGIQDNYTYAQPGIQRLVSRLKDLMMRIDAPLAAHLAKENVEFIQFAFRWMNCLLMREVGHHITIRMWDTYLSEEGDLNDFHVYVCAAFLVRWSKELRAKEFPDIMLFLQSPPTKDWTEKDTELLLSEAFMWKSLFHNSPSHLAK